MEVGEEGDYTPIATLHHQNDFCIKVGSGESHFNVSFIVRDKVTRQCPQTTTFEEEGEPKRIQNRGLSAYQPNALPLGQTGSQAASEYMFQLICSSHGPKTKVAHTERRKRAIFKF